jgi:hypothetical protein
MFYKKNKKKEEKKKSFTLGVKKQHLLALSLEKA